MVSPDTRPYPYIWHLIGDTGFLSPTANAQKRRLIQGKMLVVGGVKMGMSTSLVDYLSTDVSIRVLIHPSTRTIKSKLRTCIRIKWV